jgi:hypothetical protein
MRVFPSLCRLDASLAMAWLSLRVALNRCSFAVQKVLMTSQASIPENNFASFSKKLSSTCADDVPTLDLPDDSLTQNEVIGFTPASLNEA